MAQPEFDPRAAGQAGEALKGLRGYEIAKVKIPDTTEDLVGRMAMLDFVRSHPKDEILQTVQPPRDELDEAINDLRQPQHLPEYQDAEGFTQEAEDVISGKKSIDDITRRYGSGVSLNPDSSSYTWEWEGKQLDMPPPPPEQPPHSQN